MLCVLSCYGSFSLTTVAVAALFRRTDNDGTFKFGAHLVPVCATYEKKHNINGQTSKRKFAYFWNKIVNDLMASSDLKR